MRSSFASKLLVLPTLAAVALGAVAYSSCGSVTPVADGGRTGAAGSSGGGTTGAAGTGGTTGAGGTTGVGGTTGTGGRGGAGLDGGVLACRTDANDCPQGFTCACGGAGPGMCTCHRNCTDTNQCPVAEPMCGCPSTTGAARFCVNQCFCSCN